MINDKSGIHNEKSVQIRSFIWPVFHFTRSEYRNSQRKSLYSVRIREKHIIKKPESRPFLHNDCLIVLLLSWIFNSNKFFL